jgi:antitoxin YefM
MTGSNFVPDVPPRSSREINQCTGNLPGKFHSMSTISYTEARESLASVWDETVSTREPVIISRRGSETVVLVPWDEWRSVVETAHLHRSPANDHRLLAALQRLDAGQGRAGQGTELMPEQLAGKM